MKNILICMLKLVKYTLTLMNQLENNQRIVNGQDLRIKFDKTKSLLKNIAIVKLLSFQKQAIAGQCYDQYCCM